LRLALDFLCVTVNIVYTLPNLLHPVYAAIAAAHRREKSRQDDDWH
jgi:hypothetical protein